VIVNGTLVEDKMRRFKSEYAHFRFNKCPIYTHDGASAKYSTNSQETNNSAGSGSPPWYFLSRSLMISQGSTPGEIILCTPQTREYIDWQWPLSCVHSVMMVFSAQLGDVGGRG
jgi:hypothetical protein